MGLEKENKKEIEKETPIKRNDKEDKKGKLKLKQKEKTELLAKVPTHDAETGRAYNKALIRRMMRRVKRGLTALPTKEEMKEIKKEERKIKQEDSLVYQGSDDDEEMEEENDEEKSDKEGNIVDEDVDMDQSESQSTEKSEEKINLIDDKDSDNNTTATPKSKKIIPVDYVCQACQNKHTPLHWIYNCPDKITKQGCNQKKKNQN